MVRRLRFLALLLAVVTLAAFSRSRLAPEAAQIGKVREVAWLPSGRAVRATSMGQRLLLADIYWLRTVMYIGESSLVPGRGYAALYGLGDLVTDLDPRFGYGYQVVASNLSGLAKRVDQSDRLLEKGMRNVPDRWMLPFLMAFNKFFYEGDYAAAARYARQAGQVGGRPQLALLAANLSLVVDSEEEYDTAIGFLQVSRQQATNPEVRAELDQRLVKVLTYRELSRCERAIAAFEARSGRPPITLIDLVASGLLPALPVDPSGGQILYDLATQTVRSTVVGARQPIRATP